MNLLLKQTMNKKTAQRESVKTTARYLLLFKFLVGDIDGSDLALKHLFFILSYRSLATFCKGFSLSLLHFEIGPLAFHSVSCGLKTLQISGYRLRATQSPPLPEYEARQAQAARRNRSNER